MPLLAPAAILTTWLNVLLAMMDIICLELAVWHAHQIVKHVAQMDSAKLSRLLLVNLE